MLFRSIPVFGLKSAAINSVTNQKSIACQVLTAGDLSQDHLRFTELVSIWKRVRCLPVKQPHFWHSLKLHHVWACWTSPTTLTEVCCSFIFKEVYAICYLNRGRWGQLLRFGNRLLPIRRRMGLWRFARWSITRICLGLVPNPRTSWSLLWTYKCLYWWIFRQIFHSQYHTSWRRLLRHRHWRWQSSQRIFQD